MRISTLLLGTCWIALASYTGYLVAQRSGSAQLLLAEECPPTPAPHIAGPPDTSRPRVGHHERTDAPSTLSPQARRANAGIEPTVEELNLAMEAGLRAQQQRHLLDASYRSARLRSEKLSAWMNYREAIGVMGLTPEQAEKFTELLAEQRVRSVERPIVIPENSSAAAEQSQPAAWIVRRNLEEQRRNAEVEALLGRTKYDEWLAYQDTISARREVGLLAREFEVGGDPLLPDQRELLIGAIADAERNNLGDGGRTETGSLLAREGERSIESVLKYKTDSVARSNELLRQVASGFLTPRQLEVYQRSLDRRLDWAKVQRELFTATSPADGGSVASATP